MKRLFFLFFASAWVLNASAAESPLVDKIAALKSAMKAEIASTPSTSTVDPRVMAYRNSSVIDMTLSGLLGPNPDESAWNNAPMAIDEILAAYHSDAVQQAGQALIREIRDEKAARDAAYAAEIQAVLSRLKEIVSKATKPEDLDGILVDLQKYQNRYGGGYSPETQSLVQSVNAAYQFATAWQDYLHHKSVGQITQAQNDLRNLAQNSYGVTIIPRSAILAQSDSLVENSPATGTAVAQPADRGGDIIRGVKTLDDIAPALERLRVIDFNELSNEDHQSIQVLNQYENVYTSVKAGVPVTLNLNPYGTETTSIDPELSSRLLLFVMRQTLSSYQGAPPADAEKPREFLDKVIADAMNRNDWQLLRQALSFDEYLRRNSGFSNQVNVYSRYENPTDSLIAAGNQEAAGQYAAAVQSYEDALKSTSPYVPTKYIGEHLDEIKKDHPKEFADGINPPDPPDNTVSHGMPMPNPYEMMRMQMKQGGLSIPGRTPSVVTPAPSAAPTNVAPSSK